MKPSFALNLSHDGISLLHRAQAGWLSVGDVSLDAPDLVDELVVLRRTAADLEAEGMTTKLVIPNSQILYVEVDAPGPSRADRIAQIRDALVGLTPYDPSDLVFDWKMKKGKAQVAVVTRATLAEAETFATQYRFNPVSFVAMPAKGEFDGEPFFGPTRHAARLLEGGETVEPDKRRIEVLGKLGDAPEPAEASAPKPRRGRGGAAVAAVEEAEAAPGDPVPGGAGPEHEAATEAPEAAEGGVVFSHSQAAPDDSEATAEPEPEVPLSFASRRGAAAHVNGHAVPPAAAAPAPEAPPAGPKVEDLPPVESRPAVRVAPPENEAAAPETTSPESAAPEGADDAPSAGAAPEESAPGPRRVPPVKRVNGAPLPPPVKITPRSTDPASPAARAAAVNPEAPELAKKADPVMDMAADTALGAAVPERKGRGRLADTLGRMSGRDKAARESSAAEEMATALKGPATTFDRPSAPPSKPEKARPVTATEADAMTVFGARGQVPPRARPRFLGAALTLIVLLALAAVALWSTWLMDDVASGWFGLGDEPAVTEAEEPAPVIVPDTLTPATEPEPEIAGLPDGAEPDAAGAGSEAATEAPAEDTPPVEPSVPLPGIEVTALQPEPDETPPVAPDAPRVETEGAATPPAAPEETPPAVTGAGDTPPELAAASPALPETPGIDTSAAEPPAVPEAPAEDTAAGASGATSLDDTPPSDIATIAPELADSAAPSSDITAPADGGAAPDELEIVRLDAPPASEDAPQAEVSAPAPTQVAPPTPAEAEAIYERTGVSVLAPPAIDSPGIDRIDGTVLSSADVALAEPAERGLPEAEALVPEAPTPATAGRPPLPLVEFDLDARGLVRATEEGALSPKGVMVYRGEPSVVPPPRPGTEPPVDDSQLREAPGLETPAEETELAVETPAEAPPLRPEEIVEAAAPPAEEAGAAPEGEAAAAAAEETAALDPERVSDLAPILDESDLAEAEERARFGGLTREELAAIRPTERPGEATVELAAATPADTAGTAGDGPAAETEAETEAVPEPDPDDPLIDYADVVPPLRPGTEVPGRGDNNPSLAGELLEEETAALDGEAEAAVEEQTFEDATELAVAASLTPATRPAGFASVVQAALDEAATAPAPPQEETAANDPTPDVSVPVRAPEIPTSASVAATATDENALRLNRVNLIGIYGSASNRRALVRLASGRYVKVQVGDEVDGGQVAAIGDDRLSYVKRGRTITLTLPTSG
ncbi:hypothetical protein P1J78_06595 [Psychromarinibacter sp. C21-152]|uniref:Type IV pilus biogenesis protein PilP n=1 Tax=Psychromarinibacter sediminicola TaxID=3033385 RepID=A0AAE3NTQ7_9RHOB|nr:hypothetical protein [Psychromarinibacter sediminicola]MDF0600392.1 hypothetical protein [Psychromarinibacter sediminicola]